MVAEARLVICIRERGKAIMLYVLMCKDTCNVCLVMTLEFHDT